MAIHKVLPGETLSVIAKKYGFQTWQELYNHPDNAMLRKLRPDPNRIAVGDQISIPAKAATLPETMVAVYAWQGKKPTRGFELCAKTISSTFPNGQSILRETRSKAEFLSLCKELAKSYRVSAFHVYSHFGMDGPIFSDGQFLVSEMNDSVLPVMNWTDNACAHFYGCNAGLSPWIIAFMGGQKVRVRGSAGFSLFSKQANRFYPFDGDPNSTPCYLDCFPGMTDLLIAKFGYTSPDNFLEDLWRKAVILPDWSQARSKHLPPRPMREFWPK